ncbi:MAG: type I polyketide synthase [Myxococcota bacterium]
MSKLPEPESTSTLKRALVAIETLQARLEAQSQASTEPIAVVGASCRFPGDTDDLDAYWALLREGVEVREPVPADRWDVETYHDPDPERPGTMSARVGGFRSSIDGFDAEFFGISPREAAELDPQHRLVLETAWEALEDAGQAPRQLLDTRTGVFVGIMSAEYSRLHVGTGDYRSVSAYTTTGGSQSFAAGRIAYVLGLRGPCVAIDTACSSSLVAVHQACQSLRAGESSLALAGGVSLMVTPELSVFLTKARVLAPDGRCKTFDASADGIGRGEGGAMLVLKRLSDATRAGDRILAVIRGSAVNHDGRSGGLTVPSNAAQEALIREALANARVDPAEVGYLEAHGTGTPLGDLVEARALAAVFGGHRRTPLLVGSVKTNFGHLDAAAGIAGLLKVALVLRHAQIPPHLHLREPNPEIPWSDGLLEVPTALSPWPEASDTIARARRIAGVSSFGLSGVNAHVVLEEPPARPVAGGEQPRGPWLLPLSARSDGALRALARSYAQVLRSPTAATAEGLEGIVTTASLRRDHHERRSAVLGCDREVLVDELERLAGGESSPRGWRRGVGSGRPPRVAFVFDGMGVNPVGVGRQLFEREHVFREALEQADAAIRRYADLSVIDLVRTPQASRLGPPIDVLQPLLFALGVALSAQWRAWGIEPDAVIGHSMGEVTAACVGGALSLDDATRVICARSRLLRQASGRGAMAVIGLCESEVTSRMPAGASSLAVAAINGPRATVISGTPQQVEEFMAPLVGSGVDCHRLGIDVAFHGPQMDALMVPLRAELAGISPGEGASAFYSTCLGGPCSGAELGPDYWARNLRAPVMFASTLTQIVQGDDWLLVEVGPHPILRPHLCAVAPGARVVGSLRRHADERETMLAGLGEAYVGGAEVCWPGVYPRPGHNVRLPTYPWQRERHWVTPAAHADMKPRRRAPAAHPLLGAELETALRPRVVCYERELRAEELGELADHQIHGRVLLPGTAVAEIALSAVEPTLGSEVELHDLVLRAPVWLDETPGSGLTVQAITERKSDDRVSFQLASRAESGQWRVHAEAELRRAPSLLRASVDPPSELDGSGGRSGADLYAELASLGLEYGPAFRRLSRVWVGDEGEDAWAELDAPPTLEHYHVHPAVLDAAFHALLAVVPPETTGEVLVPARLEQLRVWEQPQSRHAPLYSHARITSREPGAVVGEIRLCSAAGEVLAEVKGLRLQRFGSGPARNLDSLSIEPAWERAPRAEAERPPTEPGRWVLVSRGGEGEGEGEALEVAARGHGVDVTRVEPGAGLPPLGPGDELVVLCGAPADPTTLRADELEAAQTYGVIEVLDRVKQALDRPKPPRLWLVTEQAQAVRSGEPVRPTHAPVWGLGRTLGYEHPELRCRLVDLGGDRDLDGLVDEILAGTDETELAFREGERYVGRLVPGSIPESAMEVQRSGTVLITGGLGGLGLSVARWFVEHGVSHLVLGGRRGARTDEQRAAVRDLREQGCEVEAVALDVTDETAVAELLERIDRTMPPLRGLVHAAGVLDDGAIRQGDAAWLRRAMASKLRGSWNLHRLTRNRALDFFVLYGSISALLGAPGQGNYAAGNAFMQALAHHRRAQGLPAICIDWGAFGEVGMAASSELRGERLRERGMGSLHPRQGTEILARLLGSDHVTLGVADLDLPAWIESNPHLRGSPRLAPLTRARSGAPQPTSHEPAVVLARWVERLAEPGADSRADVEGHLREEVARVLRIEPSRINASTPLAKLGVDSLMGIELRNRLEASTTVRLPVSTFLESGGIASIAGILLERLEAECRLESVRESAREGDQDGWEVITL